MRSRAKAINFGVIYGMGARALARQIEVKVKEAPAFIETYFETYPGVRTFIEQTTDQARRDGWVETLLGRRRLLPDIDSDNNRVRSLPGAGGRQHAHPGHGRRPDQAGHDPHPGRSGRAGDRRPCCCCRCTTNWCSRSPAEPGRRSRTWCARGMEGALELKVPLVVDMHTGRNWAEAHG